MGQALLPANERRTVCFFSRILPRCLPSSVSLSRTINASHQACEGRARGVSVSSVSSLKVQDCSRRRLPAAVRTFPLIHSSTSSFTTVRTSSSSSNISSASSHSFCAAARARNAVWNTRESPTVHGIGSFSSFASCSMKSSARLARFRSRFWAPSEERQGKRRYSTVSGRPSGYRRITATTSIERARNRRRQETKITFRVQEIVNHLEQGRSVVERQLLDQLEASLYNVHPPPRVRQRLVADWRRHVPVHFVRRHADNLSVAKRAHIGSEPFDDALRDRPLKLCEVILFHDALVYYFRLSLPASW